MNYDVRAKTPEARAARKKWRTALFAVRAGERALARLKNLEMKAWRKLMDAVNKK